MPPFAAARRGAGPRPDLEPTVIIGEEVETFFPETGQWAHVNVLGVDLGHSGARRALPPGRVA